jgi:hypothetical protein
MWACCWLNDLCTQGQNVNTKQKDDAEKMLADTMKTAEGVLVESDSILKDVIAR